MLKRLFVLLLKGLLFFIVVWLAVIAYWQVTRRVVSSSDLLIYLVLLPIGLLLTYWLLKGTFHLGKKGIAWYRNRAAHKPENPGATDEARADAVGRQEKSLHVLGSAIFSGMGDAETWIEKTRAYEIHHELDNTLTDALGFAVRSMRIAELDEMELSDDIPLGVQRMTHMLDRVLDDLSDVVTRAASDTLRVNLKRSASDQGVVLHPEWRGPATAQVEVPPPEPIAQGTTLTGLSIFLFLPGFIADDNAERLKSLCMDWATSAGWKPGAVVVNAVVAQDSQMGLKKLGEVIQQQLQRPHQLLVLLSAVSWLDESLLTERLQHDAVWADRLRKASTIVGEAAAGVVLSNHPLVDSETQDASPSLARLSLLSLGERQKPVDVKGSIEAELLVNLSQDLEQAHGVNASQYKQLVATGDHSQGRPVELGRWLTDCLPHMSLVDDSILVGQHLGECDPVSNLLALALAVESCRQEDTPVLFCSNHGMSWRGLSVVMPVSKEA